jgi:hypothetical protein
VANGKRKGGRVTPPKDANNDGAGGAGRRRFRAPERIGPFQKPDPDRPLGQVGRRPTSPALLLVYALVWLGCGIAAFVTLHGTLEVVLGVVFIGGSLLWLRGAATAYLRQQRPPG